MVAEVIALVVAEVVAVVVAVVRQFRSSTLETISSLEILFKCAIVLSASAHCSCGGAPSNGDVPSSADDSSEYCPGNGSSASTKLYTSRVASANGAVDMRLSSSAFEFNDLASVTITTISGTAP